jgi:NAD+ synthase
MAEILIRAPGRTNSIITHINQPLDKGSTMDPSVLSIDAEAVAEQITAAVKKQVLTTLKRKGAVVAVSGGIDSSVCAAICARALGRERVVGLSLPERDSSSISRPLSKILADSLGIEYAVENIAPILEGAGCYERQDDAIRKVAPGYGPGWKCKVVIPSILEGDRLNISRLVVEDPNGQRSTNRIPLGAYLQLIAATNFKQRTRTMLTYYYADQKNYAVCGTPNRLEYDQGFFVKGGDGLADFKPIAHLYKTQVYQLGRYLGVPDEILNRPPTTDTWSLAQTQEEFYFSLPWEKMDICLYAHNHGIHPAEAAEAAGLTTDQVQRVYADIESKRRHTVPLHLKPLLVEEVPEIEVLLSRAAGHNPE